MDCESEINIKVNHPKFIQKRLHRTLFEEPLLLEIRKNIKDKSKCNMML